MEPWTWKSTTWSFIGLTDEGELLVGESEFLEIAGTAYRDELTTGEGGGESWKVVVIQGETAAGVEESQALRRLFAETKR